MTYKYEVKTCAHCSATFQPISGRQKYCSSNCKKMDYRELHREYNRIYQYNRAVATGRIKKPGVGTGYNQRYGKDNPDYKNGVGELGRIRKLLKEDINACEHCGISLEGLKPHDYVIHHKDRDNTNHARDNLELLCKRCHQLEHNCAAALPKGEALSKLKKEQAKIALRNEKGQFTSDGATTISKESRVKRPEAPSTLQKGDDIVCSTEQSVAVSKDTDQE